MPFDLFEYLSLLAPLSQHSRWLHRTAAAFGPNPNLREAIGISERSWIQKERVDYGEHDRCSTDPQGEREYRRHRKAAMA
jgi:hypothetical protein